MIILLRWKLKHQQKHHWRGFPTWQLIFFTNSVQNIASFTISFVSPEHFPFNYKDESASLHLCSWIMDKLLERGKAAPGGIRTHDLSALQPRVRISLLQFFFFCSFQHSALKEKGVAWNGTKSNQHTRIRRPRVQIPPSGNRALLLVFIQLMKKARSQKVAISYVAARCKDRSTKIEPFNIWFDGGRSSRVV